MDWQKAAKTLLEEGHYVTLGRKPYSNSRFPLDSNQLHIRVSRPTGFVGEVGQMEYVIDAYVRADALGGFDAIESRLVELGYQAKSGSHQVGHWERLGK